MSVVGSFLKSVLPAGARAGIGRVRRLAAAPSDRSAQSYTCPVCGYVGAFLKFEGITSVREAAICTKCGALERHRLQAFALEQVLPVRVSAAGSALHFAPDACLTPMIKARYERYVTADLSGVDVDVRVDMRAMQFADETFDLVYASDVLEHIEDDALAISEAWRVLKPGGIAILPVPIVADQTVEYPEPVATELYHARASGLDYFDRYRNVFARVDVITSDDAPAQYQCYVFEDRTGFPNSVSPYRPPQQGSRHLDAVPICYK